MFFDRTMILRARSALSARNTPTPDRPTATSDTTTMQKSRTFQGLRKYDLHARELGPRITSKSLDMWCYDG
jgi:hypothetical protein